MQELRDLPRQVQRFPKENPDLMGLPFQGALDRAKERQRHFEQERERARKIKSEEDKETRIANLRSAAVKRLDCEVEAWLNQANGRTGGRSPLDAAASSEKEYSDALRALDAHEKEIAMKQRAKERKTKAVAELWAAAQSRYCDPEHAALWMRSGHPKLGGKSPEEFTIDDATCQLCIGLLPAKRSRR